MLAEQRDGQREDDAKNDRGCDGMRERAIPGEKGGRTGVGAELIEIKL